MTPYRRTILKVPKRPLPFRYTGWILLNDTFLVSRVIKKDGNDKGANDERRTDVVRSILSKVSPRETALNAAANKGSVVRMMDASVADTLAKAIDSIHSAMAVVTTPVHSTPPSATGDATIAPKSGKRGIQSSALEDPTSPLSGAQYDIHMESSLENSLSL
jgi:hypothetical protein